jgi:hypothetical protein
VYAAPAQRDLGNLTVRPENGTYGSSYKLADAIGKQLKGGAV